MIKQIHLNECDSTQDVLKEQLNNSHDECILVSCEDQILGRGRGENNWSAMPGTICFSLNLKANPELSFTALEISVIFSKYFETKGKKLKLKWPNDLWDESGKKCGGILVQGSQNSLLAGIGFNIYSDQNEYGSIYETPFDFDKKALALELAQYILKHRILDKKNLQQEWLIRCGHLNQMVKITEGQENFEGVFQGLGDFGEAMVCIDGKSIRIFNGSLRVQS